MTDIKQLLAETRESGMIYDPWVTATIINYEGGSIARCAFYATNCGDSDKEQVIKESYITQMKTELGDMMMQMRILVEVYGMSLDDIWNLGEAKLRERAAEYKTRGVKPRERLAAALQRDPFAPENRRIENRKPYAREGD